MKQVLIKDGSVIVEDVPAPSANPRNVLVQVAHSCVSVGTELASVELSGMPLYRRALAQPHHAKKVLEIARDEGLARTYKRVTGMLAAGTATGYSAAGRIVELGAGVEGFKVGDLVACAGAGIANHAELIDVPVNLTARVPTGLGSDLASTVTLGAIALQGVRRAAPTLGETIGVIGLGALGQLTAQLLRAAGCRVLGSDRDPGRVAAALAGGMAWGVDPATDPFEERATLVSDGFGLDAVIITAAGRSDDIVREACRACRRKGRVIIVGDVGLGLQRHEIYQKELDVLISTSYGPGRYDPMYEQEGHDYPIAYVRWTENRNMEEYLRLLADGRVSLDGLETTTFPVNEAAAAYASLQASGPKPLFVVLHYPENASSRDQVVRLRQTPARSGRIRTAIVGAGGFATSVHIPNLLRLRDSFELRAVMSRTGATAKAAATRAEAAYATTDYDAILADDDIDLVVISTRHDQHASLALRALEAGKHVFVEKPLALCEEELAAIEHFYAEHTDGPLLMTGFNRRFSPALQHALKALAGRTSPVIADYRMNAGYIPLDHWVHGPEGGGRNIGEACHIYDVFAALVGGAAVETVTARSIRPASKQWALNDNFVATVSYTDGSLCTLTYTALGHRDHPKEQLDAFADGKALSLDDYKSLDVKGCRGGGWKAQARDKGHRGELAALARALREGGPWPISLASQLATTRVSFDVERQIMQG